MQDFRKLLLSRKFCDLVGNKLLSMIRVAIQENKDAVDDTFGNSESYSVYGGAVNAIIINELFNANAPINDIDIYVYGNKHLVDSSVIEKTTDSMNECDSLLEKKYIDSHLFISQKKIDILNIIEYSSIFCYDILNSFDINATKVGCLVDGKYNNHRIFFDESYIEFLETKQLKIINFISPVSSILRIYKKYKEFNIAYLDIELEAAKARLINSYNSSSFKSVSLNKILKFSKKECVDLMNIFSEIYVVKKDFKDLSLHTVHIKAFSKKNNIYQLTLDYDTIKALDNPEEYIAITIFKDDLLFHRNLASYVKDSQIKYKTDNINSYSNSQKILIPLYEYINRTTYKLHKNISISPLSNDVNSLLKEFNITLVAFYSSLISACFKNKVNDSNRKEIIKFYDFYIDKVISMALQYNANSIPNGEYRMSYFLNICELPNIINNLRDPLPYGFFDRFLLSDNMISKIVDFCISHSFLKTRTISYHTDHCKIGGSFYSVDIPKISRFVDLINYCHNNAYSLNVLAGRLEVSKNNIKFSVTDSATTISQDDVNIYITDLKDMNESIARGDNQMIIATDYSKLVKNSQIFSLDEVLCERLSIHDMTFSGVNVKHLITERELEHEGNIMNHCVVSYAPRVKHGQSIIISLKDDKESSTAEISINDSSIVLRQHKGISNITPSSRHELVLKEVIYKIKEISKNESLQIDFNDLKQYNNRVEYNDLNYLPF